ncbi:hypothetical protein [Yinghuangia sp. YIM S09857]|uniref:hypothetical protein n=1 Tax=Yinghuangia sp. YIM S09857 TaxID=3436929 RepID=UPI003F5332BD
MRARTARIAAAFVFVAGASLAVAGMAAAEEPDKCATNPFASGCELDLGILPSASESPSSDAGLLPGDGTETPTDDNKPGNGDNKGDETSSSAPATTPPATDTSSQPPTDGGTTPPTSAPPTVPPATETTAPPTGPPATSPGQECDIARGGVDCGDGKESSSAPAGDGGPQRNYGGGTTPAAGAAAGSAGTTAGSGAELADTGQGANLALVVAGGTAMAAGGFAFTVLPGRLNRRAAGAATA